MLRLFVELPLASGAELTLPAGATRHVQVRRLQPGDPLVLFDGHGGEWMAHVVSMTRSAVAVCVQHFVPARSELDFDVTLAVGMPANERMDYLVEKATELGVACIQPLHCARSVLRLTGDRAERKRSHWQALAVASSEQCARTRVPRVAPVCALGDWLAALTDNAGSRWLLSPGAASGPPARPAAGDALLVLSGPEGGLTADEEALAGRAGFAAVSLGPRVLRADTAPVALLAWLGLGK